MFPYIFIWIDSNLVCMDSPCIKLHFFYVVVLRTDSNADSIIYFLPKVGVDTKFLLVI